MALYSFSQTQKYPMPLLIEHNKVVHRKARNPSYRKRRKAVEMANHQGMAIKVQNGDDIGP
jgi:hypothetical protein